MSIEIKVGQSIYYKGLKRHLKTDVQETTVSRVGRKFFYITDLPDERFDINTLTHDNGNYSPSYEIIPSLGEYLEAQEYKTLRSFIEDYFRNYSKQKTSLQQLRKISSILKDKEGIDVASDSKPIYPSKENGFNRGLGSPYDKVNENLLTSDNNSEVSPVATLDSSAGNSIELLTPEALERIGFKKDTIDNPFFFSCSIQLGRGRELSVGNPGTPNEMVFINERSDRKPSCVVIRNFDYDGKTSLQFIVKLLQLLNKEQNAQVCDASKAQSKDEPLPPKSESELRDKFYDDWNYKNPNGLELAPEIFNWFKPYLKTQ